MDAANFLTMRRRGAQAPLQVEDGRVTEDRLIGQEVVPVPLTPAAELSVVSDGAEAAENFIPSPVENAVMRRSNGAATSPVPNGEGLQDRGGGDTTTGMRPTTSDNDGAQGDRQYLIRDYDNVTIKVIKGYMMQEDLLCLRVTIRLGQEDRCRRFLCA